ncbi:hypothetical protein FSP39_024172 [Pinctada imbricata]|uniref:C-type lectin domain-containing protein n=1 Tax=Pinctada imbricata TaxID=66713 RepID=A0AA88XIK6_PINIB|nr:hypothetical protein FSP39_024172 [Pinctada imbricata]
MENNFVKGMSRQLHKEGDSNPEFSVWIGIHYDEKEGKWMIFLDMILLGKTFSDWAPSEPSGEYNGDREEFGSLKEHLDFQWNDVNCERQFPFIREQILSSK